MLRRAEWDEVRVSKRLSTVFSAAHMLGVLCIFYMQYMQYMQFMTLCFECLRIALCMQ
jgi:hypothetical protein